MPIVSSEIIENSQQSDGRHLIIERHTSQAGKVFEIKYMVDQQTDVNQLMLDRVNIVDQMLIEQEISKYLDRIENGLNVIGETYSETTQQYRALRFLRWAKERVNANDFQALQFAYLVTENYTETQINNLLFGTEFENKADKIKIWESKLRNMKTAMGDSATAAEGV